MCKNIRAGAPHWAPFWLLSPARGQACSGLHATQRPVSWLPLVDTRGTFPSASTLFLRSNVSLSFPHDGRGAAVGSSLPGGPPCERIPTAQLQTFEFFQCGVRNKTTLLVVVLLLKRPDFYFIVFYYILFFESCLQHPEVPRPGMEPMTQL